MPLDQLLPVWRARHDSTSNLQQLLFDILDTLFEYVCITGLCKAETLKMNSS